MNRCHFTLQQTNMAMEYPPISIGNTVHLQRVHSIAMLVYQRVVFGSGAGIRTLLTMYAQYILYIAKYIYIYTERIKAGKGAEKLTTLFQ